MKIYFNPTGDPPKACAADEYEIKFMECEDGKRYCYPKTPSTLKVWGEVRECTQTEIIPSLCLVNGVAKLGDYSLFPVEFVLFDSRESQNVK